MDKQIEKQVSAVAEAKSAAAIGAGFAADYVEVKGVTLYYQTVAHAWIIPMAVNCLGDKIGVFEKGLVVAYLLAQTAEEVRNRCMQEVRKGVLLDRAMDFFISRGITPEDLNAVDVESLMRNPYEKNS